MAIGLMLASANAAEAPSPLIGISRDQLLVRYGEPRSQIEQGNRVVYFYPRERVVLVNNVVVDVEQVSAEPSRRLPEPSVTAPQGEAPAPATKEEPRPTPSPAEPATSTRPSIVAPPAEPEPKVEIKLVRPPGSPPLPAGPAPSATPPPAPKAVEPPAPVAAPEPARPPAPKRSEPQRSAAELEAAKAKELAAAKAEAEKRANLEKARRRLDEAALQDPLEGFFSTRNLLIAGALLVAGAGFWMWRKKRFEGPRPARPASAPLATAASAAAKPNQERGFTPELLVSLDWKRFEELVAAYYSKTGVVAVRTNTGPNTPVHIRISWKGEPRPFACVQCIAHPAGPVEAKSLQEFAGVLAAEDIRRGYVVTSGTFSEAARALAQEKHLTLMPGDMFLEKLNALPVAARTEILRSIGVE